MEAIKLLLVLFVVSFVWCDSVFKCCPPNQDLSYNASLEGEVNGQDLRCVPSVSGTLSVPFHTDFITDLPNCSKFRFVDGYQKSQIYCVDRISQLNLIIGLACLDPNANNYSAPTIANFRKCCPPNRKYDAEKQFCWNPLSANYSNALADTLKLVGYRNKFVNVQVGVPACRSTEAVLDTVVHYHQVNVNKKDAMILMRTSSPEVLSLGEYCVDVVDDIFEHLVVRSCRDIRIVCKDKPCVRKCCPEGHEMRKRKCVRSKRPLNLTFFNATKDANVKLAVKGITPALLYKDLPCKNGKYHLDNEGVDRHILQVDGQVLMLSPNKVLSINEYCVENIDSIDETKTMLCFREWKGAHTNTDELQQTILTVCEVLSAFFLLLTFIVYATLPSLSNQHGRLIMCYLITSMFSYVIIVIQKLLPSIFSVQSSPTICKSAGYLMLFTFLSSFSWLNIISFDIWSTFRAVKSSFLKKSKSGKRFSFCCLYGWGFSATWTTFALFSQLSATGTTLSILKPDIGLTSCWFSNYGVSKIPFFIVPVALMITFNVILFVVTVRFVINIKLFILMGLNWSMELVSLAVQPENRAFFLISDVLNALVGVIIFCLFVLKRKVLRDLKTTFWKNDTIRHGLERATGFTASTTSSIVQSIINTRKGVAAIP